MRRAAVLLIAIAITLAVGSAGAVIAQEPDKAKAESDIRAAFAQWTEDFNAARADKICDLFARDLVSNYRGVPERGYDRQCKILHDALTDSARRFHYALEIKEIMVFGDIAIARVAWTLTIRQRALGTETTIVEPSLDVFRKDSDGQWRIFRYLSFDEG
ncbi:MAG: nuclear transport factor 2 family protein [Pseudorhodoplanes sp.]